MTDIVDPAVRSRMMSNIRSKNTRHEIVIRKELHAAGLRYRLHRSDLPGSPDITLPRHRAVVFVHGCFWHGHNCHLFKWPSSNSERWKRKILGNQSRDAASAARLLDSGWRVGTIWECALRGRTKLQRQDVVDLTADWIRGTEPLLEVRGGDDDGN